MRIDQLQIEAEVQAEENGKSLEAGFENLLGQPAKDSELRQGSSANLAVSHPASNGPAGCGETRNGCACETSGQTVVSLELGSICGAGNGDLAGNGSDRHGKSDLQKTGGDLERQDTPASDRASPGVQPSHPMASQGIHRRCENEANLDARTANGHSSASAAMEASRLGEHGDRLIANGERLVDQAALVLDAGQAQARALLRLMEKDEQRHGELGTGPLARRGNPFGRHLARRRCLASAWVKDGALRKIILRMVQLAQKGDVRAARIVLDYTLGRPAGVVDPDGLDTAEWKYLKASALPGKEFAVILEAMPAEAVNIMARGLMPIATMRSAEILAQHPAPSPKPKPAKGQRNAKNKRKLREHGTRTEKWSSALSFRKGCRPFARDAAGRFSLRPRLLRCPLFGGNCDNSGMSVTQQSELAGLVKEARQRLEAKPLSVAVVGDMILDTAIEGIPSGRHPDIGVAILREATRQESVGGAANIGMALSRLGAQVTVFGIVGSDLAGRQVGHMLSRQKFEYFLVSESGWPTPRKDWIYEKGPDQTCLIRRIDYDRPLSGDAREELVGEFRTRCPDGVDVVILTDHGLGSIGPESLAILGLARQRGARLVAIPRTEVLSTHPLDAIVLNGQEMKRLAGAAADADPHHLAASYAHQYAQHVFLTLLAEGIYVCPANASAVMIPGFPLATAHWMGARDMATAIVALGLGLDFDVESTGRLANAFRHLIARQRGNGQVRWPDIEQFAGVPA